jgi:hypothetical protein
VRVWIELILVRIYPVKGSFEHGNESPVSIKDGILSDYQLLKKDSATLN